MLWCAETSSSVLQCVAVCCSVSQCVAVCCSVLQCVAMCCNVLQYFKQACTVRDTLSDCYRENIAQEERKSHNQTIETKVLISIFGKGLGDEGLGRRS